MKADKCFAVKDDIATSYAQKAGITVKEAKQRVNDVVDLMVEFLVDPEVDGIMLRNLFTIEKTVKSARKGKVPMNGIEYETRSARKLKISTGKILSDKLNAVVH